MQTLSEFAPVGDPDFWCHRLVKEPAWEVGGDVENGMIHAMQ